MNIIKEPFRGAPHTVEAIVKSALASQQDFTVRQLAERVCGEVRSKDYLSEAFAVYHFVDGKCRYMKDPRTIELVKSPSIVARELMSGTTPNLDCDDMTALILALMLVMGARCRVVTVAFDSRTYRGERQYSHVFVQFQEPKSGTWVSLDPVARERTASMHARTKFARIYPVG